MSNSNTNRLRAGARNSTARHGSAESIQMSATAAAPYTHMQTATLTSGTYITGGAHVVQFPHNEMVPIIASAYVSFFSGFSLGPVWT